MIKKIGIIGTGDVGTTLGNAWKYAGYDVVLGSRKPGNIKKEILPVKSLNEAAEHGELIVNTTPGEVALNVLKKIDPELLTNKVLIDISVGLSGDYSSLIYQVESGAELIQNNFPNSKVVKTLCTMTSTIMVNPGLLEKPTTAFLSGNDPESKVITSHLLNDLGWPKSSLLDLGNIQTARGQEHFAMLYFALTESLDSYNFNIKVYTEKNK